MSIKIIDTCTAINIFEKIRSFDSTIYLKNYSVIVTREIYTELSKGSTFNCPLDVYDLSDEERELYDDTETYMFDLGEGERSALVHALFLSNQHACSDSDKIIVLSDDKEAGHTFCHKICSDPYMKKLFPNASRIIWSDTVGLVKKWQESNLLNKAISDSIFIELCNVVGPKKLNFLKL